MKKIHVLAVVLLASGGLAMPVSAQLIVPVGDGRSVSCSAETDDMDSFDSDSDSAAAVLYEYFNDSVSATAQINNGFADAGASQDSLLGSDYIIASGSAFAVGESYDPGVLAQSSGLSSVFVEFHLTAPASYRWYGDISAVDGAFASVSLTGSPGFSTGMTATGPSEMFTIDESGALEPGSYTLNLRALAGASASGALAHGLADFQISLELTTIGGSYCVGLPNTAGSGAHILSDGSQSIADNSFTLGVSGARPDGPGLFFYGTTQVQVPFGDGFRCVGGQTHRLQPPMTASPLGVLIRPIDFTAPPMNAGAGAILPGETWNFQLWYRDPGGPGGTGFNLSNGLWATFTE